MTKEVQVALNASSDIDREIEVLRKRLVPSFGSQIELDAMLAEVRASASTLVEQAKSIAAVGSQFSGTRTVTRDTVVVHLDVRSGERHGIWHRFKSLLGAR